MMCKIRLKLILSVCGILAAVMLVDGNNAFAQSVSNSNAPVVVNVQGATETPISTATSTSTATATSTAIATSTATATSTSESGDSGFTSTAPVVSKLPDTGVSTGNSAGAQWMSLAIAAGFFLAMGGLISSRSNSGRRAD